MRSAHITSPPAGSGICRCVAALMLVTLLLSCAPAAVDRPTPAPPTSVIPTTTVDSQEPQIVPTPVAAAHPRIERVTLATRVGNDGAPLDETTVVSEWPEMIYLCVLMSEIGDGTRLRAYWFQNADIVGQSDMSPPATDGQPAWIALRYRPVARLNPAASYAVELRLGDDLVDRYLFRVGAGNPADAIAELAFTTGFDGEGDPIEPRSKFPPDTSPLALRMRISNQVDPAGMIFTSLWYRGDAQIAHINGQPIQANDSSEPDPRQIEFIYTPSAPLPQGRYRVDVLLNGATIRSAQFEISTEPDPPTPTTEATETPEPESTATTEPSPTASATASPTASPSPSASPTASPRPDPNIRDVTTATQIDHATAAPLDAPIFSLERQAGSVTGIWLAILVEDLSEADSIEIVILLDNVAYDRASAPRVTRSSGWIAAEFQLDVPAAGGASTYTFEVLLNGQRTLATSCQIRGV